MAQQRCTAAPSVSADGLTVTDVAASCGVSRQTAHLVGPGAGAAAWSPGGLHRKCPRDVVQGEGARVLVAS